MLFRSVQRKTYDHPTLLGDFIWLYSFPCQDFSPIGFYPTRFLRRQQIESFIPSLKIVHEIQGSNISRDTSKSSTTIFDKILGNWGDVCWEEIGPRITKKTNARIGLRTMDQALFVKWARLFESRLIYGSRIKTT